MPVPMARPEYPASVQCPRCDWQGARLKRGGLPAHKRTLSPRRARWGVPTDGASGPCDGPTADKSIGKALGEAFAAAGRAPMPSPRYLTCSVPQRSIYGVEIYRAAPPWARYVVTVHAPMETGAGRAPEARERCTVAHYFADRLVAEEWAYTCSLHLGSRGTKAVVAGYVAVCVLHRAMKRWESLAGTRGVMAGRDCGIESPVTYAAIDPGGVLVRYADPSYYPGYGDAPSRSLWDRTWS